MKKVLRVAGKRGLRSGRQDVVQKKDEKENKSLLQITKDHWKMTAAKL